MFRSLNVFSKSLIIFVSCWIFTLWIFVSIICLIIKWYFHLYSKVQVITFPLICIGSQLNQWNLISPQLNWFIQILCLNRWVKRINSCIRFGIYGAIPSEISKWCAWLHHIEQILLFFIRRQICKYKCVLSALKIGL